MSNNIYEKIPGEKIKSINPDTYIRDWSSVFLALPLGTFIGTACSSWAINQWGGMDVLDHAIAWGGNSSAYLSWLNSNGIYSDVMARFLAISVTGVASGLMFSLYAAKPYKQAKVARGRELLSGRAATRAITAILKREGLDTKVILHPKIPSLSRDRLTRGVLVMGGIGSGKTQIISRLINSSHKDPAGKCLVYDAKGDFTSSLAKPLVLLAPWDKRSVIWDVARDITSRPDAQLFARTTIKESSDPMWSAATQQILVALIVELQIKLPRRWSWGDLAELASSSEDKLEQIIKCHSPEATATAENLKSKTGVSIRITLASYLTPIFDLARYWPSRVKGKMFSFSRWLDESWPSEKTVILQGSSRHESLMRSYASAAIAITIARISDPAYEESKSRRLHFFLDESPQLGKINPLIRAIEMGRSKGLCILFGMQDLAQIQKIYGREAAQIITGSCATHIYCRVSNGETADWSSKSIGQQEVEWLDMDGQIQKETRPVLMPAQFSDLQTGKEGNEAFVVGLGNFVYRLKWPIFDMGKIRPAVVSILTLNAKKKLKISRKGGLSAVHR